MELTNSMIANLAMNFLGQAIQNGGVEEIFNNDENNNVQKNVENKNQEREDAGLFNREYEAEEIYSTVGQIAGYAYGGVTGGDIRKIFRGPFGGLILDVKEKVLWEEFPFF